MERNDAPRNSPVRYPEDPGRKTAAKIPGQLSLAEEFLYTGARRIDQLIDLIRDRPLIALAIGAAGLAMATLLPDG